MEATLKVGLLSTLRFDAKVYEKECELVPHVDEIKTFNKQKKAS